MSSRRAESKASVKPVKRTKDAEENLLVSTFFYFLVCSLKIMISIQFRNTMKVQKLMAEAADVWETLKPHFNVDACKKKGLFEARSLLMETNYEV